MSKIITISREFGSGGRELGKRLAGAMGIVYYDYEIIKGIAEKSGLAVEYVDNIVEHHSTASYPIRIGRSFAVANILRDRKPFRILVYADLEEVIPGIVNYIHASGC